MLKNQLQAIKNKKRTFLRVKHGRIHFIDALDMDTENILSKIDYKHRVFSHKSLRIDRHQFSEAEERKFCINMRKFLFSLIDEMNRDDISYILEYLVRVYNVDTFNKDDLLFLLLPYEKYIKQIEQLTYRGNVHITNYDYTFIAKYFIFNNRHFSVYVKYFKHFDLLDEFLSKSLIKIVELLKDSKTDHLNEISFIFDKLKEKGRNELILTAINIGKNYFNCKEFLEEYNNL